MANYYLVFSFSKLLLRKHAKKVACLIISFPFLASIIITGYLNFPSLGTPARWTSHGNGKEILVPLIDSFNFRYFEKLQDDDIVPAASIYLNSKYPVGSVTTKLIDELKKAGADCSPINEGPKYFQCTYEIIPSHGHIESFLSHAKWYMKIDTEEYSNQLKSIFIRRTCDGKETTNVTYTWGPMPLSERRWLTQ